VVGLLRESGHRGAAPLDEGGLWWQRIIVGRHEGGKDRQQVQSDGSGLLQQFSQGRARTDSRAQVKTLTTINDEMDANLQFVIKY